MQNTLYEKFISYYGNVEFTFLKQEQDWLIYAVRIHSFLNLYRYIFIVIPYENIHISNKITLNEAKWISFQTRTSEELFKVPVLYFISNIEQQHYLSDILQITNRNSNESTYMTSLPISVKLLHEEKKNNYLQYPDKLKLYQALETYNCVIEKF